MCGTHWSMLCSELSCVRTGRGFPLVHRDIIATRHINFITFLSTYAKPLESFSDTSLLTHHYLGARDPFSVATMTSVTTTRPDRPFLSLMDLCRTSELAPE